MGKCFMKETFVLRVHHPPPPPHIHTCRNVFNTNAQYNNIEETKTICKYILKLSELHIKKYRFGSQYNIVFDHKYITYNHP